MKRDRQGKVEFIGRHIPEFPGYRAIDHGETDRLLRHYLAGRMAGIGERLADLAEQGAQREPLAGVLRRLGQLRERLLENAALRTAGSGLDEDEALLDFDLNLLDKAAALEGALEGEGTASLGLLPGLLDEFEALLDKRAVFFR